MLDNEGRIVIQSEFVEFQSGHGEVYIYFSTKENLYFILPTDNKNEFFVYSRNLDEKRRFFVPAAIIKQYGKKQLILAKKNGIIYILPIFPPKDG